MKIEDIIKLVDAGFTKEEIAAFNSEPAQAAPAEDTDVPEETPEDKPEPAPVKQTVPANQQPDRYDQLMKAFEELSNRIVSQNINRTVTDGTPARSAEDILAEVINPPRKEGKK